MGILNVTPDSFSDGGRYVDPDVAIAHAKTMIANGAHIIDVGGESTRPGSQRVPIEEEIRRVIPVVRALTAEGVAVSVDTMNAPTMEVCLDAGASYINDVSAGQIDPNMLAVAAQSGAELILMHWRGLLTTPGQTFHYTNVIEEVRAELIERFDAAVTAGVNPDKIILDPGLGFSKNAHHNWEILARMDRLMDIGPRVLIAASRKRFLTNLLTDHYAQVSEQDVDAATSAITVAAQAAGAWGVRVHDVRTSVITAAVAERIQYD